MGLYISSVSAIPLSAPTRLYVYVLDYYNWGVPASQILAENLEQISEFCAQNGATMVEGLPSSHFGSEVLSWTKINGQEPGEVLPALMITSVDPAYFAAADGKPPSTDISEPLLLFKLAELCESAEKLVPAIRQLLEDINSGRKLRSFVPLRELRKGEAGALVDALILVPDSTRSGTAVRNLTHWLDSRRSRQ